MTIYLAARFLHVVGALAMFSALGLEVAVLRGLALARSTREAHAALAGLRLQARIGGAGALLILVPGGYLAAAAWGMPPWLLAAIGALVAIIALGAIVSRKLLAALVPALERAVDGVEVQWLLRRLWSSLAARAVLLLGIVALMSTKPGWAGAVLTLGLAASAAAAAAWLALGRRSAGVPVMAAGGESSAVALGAEQRTR